MSDNWQIQIDAFPEYEMRAPCRWCEAPSKRGRIRESHNGQDVIYCAECRRHVYNAPRTETGKPQRIIRSRPDLKPGQRERVLEQCGHICFGCKRDDRILHVAHAISVKDAQEMGWSEEEYMDDANLYAACEECNLGVKSNSMEARIFLRLIQLKILRGRQK